MEKPGLKSVKWVLLCGVALEVLLITDQFDKRVDGSTTQNFMGEVHAVFIYFFKQIEVIFLVRSK
jgi:hypothetical protein